MSADDDHDHTDGAYDEGRARAHEGAAGDRSRDIVEQPLDPFRENLFLTCLGDVDLHYPHAAERLGETAGDLGIDSAAIAEQWTQPRKSDRHHPAERKQHEDRDRRHAPVEIEEHPEADDGGEQSSGELDEARSNQIPDALGVRHDARDQHAGLGGVEIGNRQVKHVRLDVLSHVGDRPLRGDAHDLGQRVSSDGLNDDSSCGGDCEGHEELGAVLSDDVIDEILGARRKDEPGEAIHQHQREADGERPAMMPDELPRLGPRPAVIDLARCLCGHEIRGICLSA